MNKIKMRCTTCGKWFQSANAKEITCPDCVQKARKEKLAAKNQPSSTGKPAGSVPPTRPTPPPPPKPKSAAGGTSHWFDTVSDVKVGEPDEPPQRPKLPSSPMQRDRDTREPRGAPDQLEERSPNGPGGYRDRDERGPGGYRPGGPGGYRDRDERGPGGYRPSGPGGYRDRDERGPGGYRPGAGGPGTLEGPGGGGYRPRQPMEGGFGRGPRPGGPGGPREQRPGDARGGKPFRAKSPRPAAPPRPKREKIPPPEPFVPTAEQIAQVEARYAELATPQEFDGIRTQIAQEIGIPKKAVKKIVQEYRERNSLLSWWEAQSYKGDSEEQAKIKAVYEPYLPIPPVGIHKKIAEELSLKAGEVYQAIKAIRLEMNLPQFNDPEFHAEELAARAQERAAAKAARELQKAAKKAEDAAKAASSAANAEHVEGVSVTETEIEPAAAAPVPDAMPAEEATEQTVQTPVEITVPAGEDSEEHK